MKSDQALEFETTLTEIATGDAVLSGRFGPSLQLKLSAEKLPVRSLYITRAAIKQSRRGKDLRISIDVKGLDDYGNDKDLEIEKLFQDLPDALLFIGNEAIPLPYDYWPLRPNKPDEVDPELTTTETDPEGFKPSEFSFARPSTRKSLRVEAWIPSRIAVTRNSSVMFRVPFCGLDYQASWPLQFFEPTVTRMGGDATHTVFSISHSLGHKKKLTVELDEVYDETRPELVKVNEKHGDYRFKIPNDLLLKYRHLVLRIDAGDPYLLPIPEDKPKPRPILDLNVKPPEIKKGEIGPVEWTGTELGLITAATLITPSTNVGSSATPATPTRTAASFAVYDSGKRIAVYFGESATNAIGKAEVEFQFGTLVTDTLRAPLFIKEAGTVNSFALNHGTALSEAPGQMKS